MNRTMYDRMIIDQNCDKIKQIFETLIYEENWSFSIIRHTDWYVALQIQINTRDSNVPRGSGMTRQLLVSHQFQIPFFPMENNELERWLLDNILLVHRHEACENFRINGEATFYPDHSEGGNPYEVIRRVVDGPDKN